MGSSAAQSTETVTPGVPCSLRAMLTQAQQQLANLDALKVLEGVVGEMYGE